MTLDPGKFLGHGAHIPIFCRIHGSKSFRSEERLDARADKKTKSWQTSRLLKKACQASGSAKSDSSPAQASFSLQSACWFYGRPQFSCPLFLITERQGFISWACWHSCVSCGRLGGPELHLSHQPQSDMSIPGHDTSASASADQYIIMLLDAGRT